MTDQDDANPGQTPKDKSFTVPAEPPRGAERRDIGESAG